MPSPQDKSTPVFFEIDSPTEFSQFIITNRREIIFYLQLLTKQRSIVTAYINDGQHFFLSSIVTIDEAGNLICLDPSSDPEDNILAQTAQKLTLVANLERVKIQFRLAPPQIRHYQGQNILTAALPDTLLRLQRREFFRLEPPLATPIHCKLATSNVDGSNSLFELTLSDISGGGVSLIAPPGMANDFPRDAVFHDCRLEIPGEGVILVNLRVRKVIEISTRDGEHSLRIGCEFVKLPGTRLAFIERYITRIERERKAHHASLEH
jgi:flagellar brake protein